MESPKTASSIPPATLKTEKTFPTLSIATPMTTGFTSGTKRNLARFSLALNVMLIYTLADRITARIIVYRTPCF